MIVIITALLFGVSYTIGFALGRTLLKRKIRNMSYKDYECLLDWIRTAKGY